MQQSSRAGQAYRIAEVARWCAAGLELMSVQENTPEEARRRGMMDEAERLMKTARYPGGSLLRRLLPTELRWERAMRLIQEAGPGLLAPPGSPLRSLALQPVGSIGDSSYSEESKQEMVDRVIALRSLLLQSQPLPGVVSTGPTGGRVLLYTPSENVWDGASQYASNGFFDECDSPPWDIWLSYSHGTLISWVPEVLVPLAQAGIEANPVECIQWAD